MTTWLIVAVAAPNRPKRNYYVHQFYLRRFACAENPNKVIVAEGSLPHDGNSVHF